MEKVESVLKQYMATEQYDKLAKLNNEKLIRFVTESIERFQPESVFVCTDSAEDREYLRKKSLQSREEAPLGIDGHTIHFDNYNDQARDKVHTKYLVSPGMNLGASLNQVDRDQGTDEVMDIMAGSMEGREMLVCFFCLGPTNSEFSISCVQITDSYYVAHSECILYHWGYEQFDRLNGSSDFFRFCHCSGKMDEGVSINMDKRRIYIDLEKEIVFSVNTQYAGNTIGLKKLALRLAINKASREGWLAEHMFVMGAHGPDGRVTYLSGAFPSACGKTSTSMIEGQSIVGDDIAYLRVIDGKFRCVNAEKGIFGIIQDVNPKDDPQIFEVLSSKNEVIFSNILHKNNEPFWNGMGRELPEDGINHSGSWYRGKVDDSGKEIAPSHKNGRYTIALSDLKNTDAHAEDPDGVELGGIIYGGRDSDTWVPIEQAFDWTEGVIAKGASLESETTAATLDDEGVRKFNIMSNMDFVSIPLGQYIQNNLDFAKKADVVPMVFSVNYFLKDQNGKFLNSKTDKKAWVLWAELRINGDVDAIQTPTGFIPKYEDLKRIFKESLNKDYSLEDYNKQFVYRCNELLAKLDRIEDIYRQTVEDTPAIVYETFQNQRQRIIKAQEQLGDYIIPEKFIAGQAKHTA
ncbi:MAG: phosphoenolpyruvate carboxykinase (GTP) [Phycisphaerae bacterium]|nr:phosphoenolpyruvate carboxykinase (GTP) [Phycisphaerae bacterium]